VIILNFQFFNITLYEKRKSDAEKLLESRDKRDKIENEAVKRKKEQSFLLRDSVVEKDTDENPMNSSSLSNDNTTLIPAISIPSFSMTTSSIHLFYKQSEKSLNVKICLFDNCHQEISFTTGSTSHLHEHTNNRHPNEYNLFKLVKSRGM